MTAIGPLRVAAHMGGYKGKLLPVSLVVSLPLVAHRTEFSMVVPAASEVRL